MHISKGHIQPHCTNLPRRRLRTCSPQNSSRTGDNLHRAAFPRPTEQAPRSPATGRTSTDSAETSPSYDEDNPLPRRKPSLTPVTSPLDVVLPPDALPEKFPLPPPQRHESLKVAVNTSFSQSLRPSANVLPNTVQPHFVLSGARGHLEPRANNLPRRPCRAQKEKDRIRKRCLQELIPGSGIWIVFDLRIDNDGDDDDDRTDGLTQEERKERDWMWEEEFGFTGVIRVRIGMDHGGCRKLAGGRKELKLVVGREEIKAFDDLGVSVLTDDQLDNAAAFLIENRLRKDAGKLLITVPPSRPVEALSIGFFALSLPSASTSLSPPSRQFFSYLSQMRLLPGILELKQSQETNNSHPISDTKSAEFCRTRTCSDFTPTQLALWHIHDLVSIDQNDESTELKQEWRGALSLDGVERLEKLIALRLKL